MRIVGVIQARMGSVRLPGKVLYPLGGQPLLVHVIARAIRSRALDDVVVATTKDRQDDPVAEWALESGAKVLRGDKADVLARFVATARCFHADAVVRLTADCPLLDPHVVARLIAEYRLGRSTGELDYAANILDRTFPRGLDTELITTEALEWLDDHATDSVEREHVTLGLYRRAGRFSVLSLRQNADFSCKRWTIDTREDYELMRRIVREGCRAALELSQGSVLRFLALNPEWERLNQAITQEVVQEIPPRTAWRRFQLVEMDAPTLSA